MWKFKFLCSENVSLTISSLFGRGRKRLIFSALLASALIAPVAHAQESNDDENELEEIVVTATRIPTPLADTLPTTAIITAEDIERIKPQDFGELLKLTSGIGFRDSGGRGSQGGLFVRGTSPKHTLVLIDGIRTSSATSGQTAIEKIPLDAIERIEIIKGPMSGVYGADAIGGVIQIFTKQYQEMGSFGTIKTTAGTNKFRKYNARVGYGEEAYSISASVSKESTDGIDRTGYKGEQDEDGEFTSGGNDDRDGFEQTAGSFGLSIHPQDDLTINLSHIQNSVRSDYDNISGDKNKIGKNWHQKDKLNSTSVRIEYEQSDSLNVTGVFGETKDHSTNFRPGKSLPTNFNTHKSDYSLQANLILSAQNQVSFGIDYQKDKIDSRPEYDENDKPKYYAENKRTNKGIFALWQYKGDQSSTVLNARHDRNSAYGSISNYGLQQSFDLNDKYMVITSFGTAFKAPTFNDLYYPGSGDSDLEPQESKSFEMSLRGSLDEINWQINIFKTKIANVIIWLPNESGMWQPTNTDSTQQGVEVEFSRKWDDYKFRTSLDYLDAKNNNTGKFLDGTARASGSIELGKQIDNLHVGVDAFFEHARFDRNRFLGGYALWGLHANYEVSESLSISGKVDNLFDKKYVTNRTYLGDNYQNEGRTIQVSVEYKF